MKRKGAMWVVITIVVMAVVAGSLASAPTDGSFRVDSYSEGGYRGIAKILDRLGFTAQEVGPTEIADVDVLVIPFPARGSKTEVDAWNEFAAYGGLVVLGSPFDEMSEDAQSAYLSATQGRGTCSLDLARGFDDWEGDIGLRLPDGVESCFDEDGVAPFFETEMGLGRVLTLAGPDVLSNESIGRFDTSGNARAAKDQPDNAGVIAELMSRSGSRVGFVAPDFTPLGESFNEQTMWDFVPPWVVALALQAMVALLWLAWWAARRPARLVHEPVPIMIAASELVEAAGSLLRRRRDPPASAETLRTATLGRLASIWGMPADAPAEQFVYEAQRQGVDAEFVQHLVEFDPVESTMTDAELVDFARRCARVRTAAERSMSTDVRSR